MTFTSYRRRLWIGSVIGFVFVGMMMPALAFELIKKDEAARRDDPYRPKPSDRRAGPYPEPEIKIQSDTVVTSPFELTIELRPGTRAATINLDSLRIIYRKDPPVNLKPRVDRFIEKSPRNVVIRITDAEAPVGKHQILIQVEDSYEQMTSRLVELDVRANR